MTTTSVNTIDAKEGFTDLLNRVAHQKERILLVRRGKEIAAIVPMEDWAALQLIQSKLDLQEAVDALKEARNTGTTTLEELKESIG